MKKQIGLDSFGFSDWIGPEPHGADPRNSGSSARIGTSGRDEVYAAEIVKLIKSLDETANCTSVMIRLGLSCVPLVNPHDIAFYGIFSAISPNLQL